MWPDALEGRDDDGEVSTVRGSQGTGGTIFQEKFINKVKLK